MTWDKKQANKKITGKTRIVCNMIWYRIQREDVCVGGVYKTRTETLQIFSRSQYVEHELRGVDAARLTAAYLRNRANSKQSPHQFLLLSYQYFKLFCERQVCTHAETNIHTTYAVDYSCRPHEEQWKNSRYLVLLNLLMFPVFCFCILCVSICSYIHNTHHFILDSNCVVNVYKCSLV